MIMHGSNPSILEVEAGGSEAQYNLQFHTESEVSWDTGCTVSREQSKASLQKRTCI